MKILLILNDPPYGTERSYNGLRLANALGFPTAHSEMRQFENVSAIVVTRYDRVWDQRAFGKCWCRV